MDSLARGFKGEGFPLAKNAESLIMREIPSDRIRAIDIFQNK
jgi:hypothetical protein